MNSDKYDMILTAGHCLFNANEGQFDFFSIDLEVIAIHIIGKLDIGAIIIKKAPEGMASNIPFKLEELNIEDSLLCGFPYLKKDTDATFECIETNFKSNASVTSKRMTYTIYFSDSFDRSKKELLEGMSGSPLLVSENKALVGIFIGTSLPDGAYSEIQVIPIRAIIDELRELDIVYFEDGIYKNGISWLNIKEENSTAIKGSNELYSLLIGRSGAGKSAFIKTFLKHSNLINSTGNGRTTRSSTEYEIFQDIKMPKVDIKFFNKEDFVKFRITQCYQILDESNDIEKPKSKEEGIFHLSEYSITPAKLLKKTIRNPDFFNYDELDFCTEESIPDQIKNIFMSLFGSVGKNIIPVKYTMDQYFDLISHLGIEKSPEKSKNDYDLDDVVRVLFEKVYDVVIGALKKKHSILFSKENQVTIKLHPDMSEQEKTFLECSLKVLENEGERSLSYTGFIEKVIVQDRVSDDYIKVFKDLHISKITLVDTYGLDHATSLSKDLLEKRLPKLMEDYPKMNTVFYLRKLGSDSPSDLELAIPTIYNINPSFRIYMVFTDIDANQSVINSMSKDPVVNLWALNQKNRINVVNYFNSEITGFFDEDHPIQQALKDNGVSTELADNIYKVIKDKLIPYCSNENNSERSHYLINNTFHIKELLRSIIRKEYLGTGYINIKKMEHNFNTNTQPPQLKDRLMTLLEEMFDVASIRWFIGSSGHGHWRTQNANIARLNRNVLGFWGTYRDVWNWRFFEAYNKVFSKLSSDDFALFFSTDPQMNDAAAIQQLLNNFSTHFLSCPEHKLFRFPVEPTLCLECNLDKCFKQILLSSYKDNELKENVGDKLRSDWLNDRSNFRERFHKIDSEVYDYFLEEFSSYFFDECKKHNARIVTEVLKEKYGTEFEKIGELIKDSLKNFERDLSDQRLREIMSQIDLYA
ncbi:hypothetical protein [Paenibacillus taichungensis]|uniref:hypothetical protein n=1 Tax=Paenibacillus taichungensis TaxID=484184 RepID=UPI0035D5CA25